MAWLALGTGLLLLLVLLARAFANARVETIRKVLVWSAAGLGGGLILLALLTGRGAQTLWALLLFGPVLWRTFQAWRSARQFRRGGAGGGEAEGGTGPGAETVVETATLVMRLDHASGHMSGRVRRGSFAGRELAELALPALLALLAECQAEDAESVPLLEAWLDRAVPDWREGEAAEPRAAGGGGPMTREEALAVLGLQEGASVEEIRAAHRRLMRGTHPDQGGSDWLAARINEARDRLLG